MVKSLDPLDSWCGTQEEETSDVNMEFNSPTRQDPLSSHFGEPSSPLDPDVLSIPPSLLDLSALHDTWEQVRAYCDNIMKVAFIKSSKVAQHILRSIGQFWNSCFD